MKTNLTYYSQIQDQYYSLFQHCDILEGHVHAKRYPNVQNLVCAFDIETTYFENLDESIMYVWQFAVEGEGLIGRTWEEFLEHIERLLQIAREREARLIIYIHNEAFEFQFLRSLLELSPQDVFLIKSRRPVKVLYKNLIEFRCSYYLSNMSLDEFTKRMEVEHQKLSGIEFDYTKIRYSWTELTENEIAYCMHDVYGLVEAVHKYMDINYDNLLTLPLTSTGFVRRDAKQAMREYSRERIENMLPDWHTYQMLREAFRGGNTHANRYYVGHILNKVYSADRSSSYPDVQCNCLFPMSPFVSRGAETVREFERIRQREKAMLFRAAFTNIRLTSNYWGCPYIPLDKTRSIREYVSENGRILKASYLEITLTDIDFEIIDSEYTFDTLEILDLSFANYGYLPNALRAVTIDYYESKTALKGLPGQELYYTKAKNLLNSIFGMMAQNPVKPEIRMYGMEYREEETDLETLLYATRKRQFMPYQWGIWVTAWARYRLEEGIRIAGDDFVYCDTDCVKSLTECNFNQYNRARVKDSKKNGATALDPKGRRHYMGVFETEDPVDRFITWGAKKYVGETDGKISVTVSGVVRRHSAEELQRAGGLEAFKPGMKFIDAGGLAARYADHELESIDLDGHRILLPSNTSLVPSEYTLGITNQYEKILLECGLLDDFD